MDIDAVNPWRWQDKFDFAHAIDVRGAQRLLFCAGQTSVDPEGRALHPGNMRAQLDCPRERSDVRVELEMDGQLLARVEARPSGLRNDLPSNIYRRLEVPAGRHTFRARLADTVTGEFRHHGEATIDLPEGRVLVVDFAASRGGFLFTHGGAS